MIRPRALVLRAAGTNCHEETVFALDRCGASADLRHVNEAIARPTLLRDYRILVLPGGFSYGDDIAAGRVLAQEVATRLAEEIVRYPGDGKLVLGICNGFQVLVRAGLLPGFGLPNLRIDASITFNDSDRFESRWVRLRARPGACCFLRGGEVFAFPVAHGEGKVVLAGSEALERLHRQGQTALTYEPRDGTSGVARYPDNPNGSPDGIAAMTDPTGRIFGLMPHPERNLFPTSHPEWTRRGPSESPDGASFFRAAILAAG